jgi:hypothetical protein
MTPVNCLLHQYQMPVDSSSIFFKGHPLKDWEQEGLGRPKK